MKDSYRVGKILKKLTGLKFLTSRQTSDISKDGKKKAQSLAVSQNSVKSPYKLALFHQRNKLEKQNDKFTQYQKEVEAEKLLGSKNKPESPGRILKLPTGRKEIMSKSEK